MTAPRPEIQRWTTMLDAPLVPKEDGEIVLYTDALRAVTMAKIEVLEEMNKNLTYKSLGNAIVDKLIALRKEIG